MATNGEKQPEQPDHIQVKAEIDLPNGVAIFTETSVNGIVSLKPKQIRVPLQSIIIMSSQALLAMNGIPSGAVKVTKEGTASPASKILGPNEM